MAEKQKRREKNAATCQRTVSPIKRSIKIQKTKPADFQKRKRIQKSEEQTTYSSLTGLWAPERLKVTIPAVMSATQRYSFTLYDFLANRTPNSITGIICVPSTKATDKNKRSRSKEITYWISFSLYSRVETLFKYNGERHYILGEKRSMSQASTRLTMSSSISVSNGTCNIRNW